MRRLGRQLVTVIVVAMLCLPLMGQSSCVTSPTAPSYGNTDQEPTNVRPD